MRETERKRHKKERLKSDQQFEIAREQCHEHTALRT